MQPTLTLDQALQRATAIASSSERSLLGIVGAPGAGKSTLAATLVDALGPTRACLVGMDGFHLAGQELARLGRASRKGAPDTFDVGGYVALLRRLRARTDGVVYAPLFRRDLEEPVGSAVPVPASVPLVITEGNYLLLSDGGWGDVRAELDEVWYLELDDITRLDRLVARHVAHGKTPEQARAWSLGSDQENARRIATTRSRADAIVVGA